MEAPLQRLLSRAARVSGHAAKKAERKKIETFKDQKWSYNYRSSLQNEQLKRMIKDAKKAREEDWASGPRLLPRRDIGKSKSTLGTVASDVIYNPTLPEKWRKKTWLAKGDRVVILTGRDRGRIGTVSEVQDEAQSCRVDGMNEISYVVPDFLAQEQGNSDGGQTVVTSRLLLWDDVKLVHAVRDEAGYFRDVVVDEVSLVESRGSKKPKRIIPGLEEEIPWPKEEEPEHEDTDSDTLRLTVDERTFRPKLNEMPMPGSVIDELRGKYSKFRTRHDEDYLARKQAEVAQLKQKADRVKEMGMTPLMRQAAQHKAQPKPKLAELSEEQLAAIGRTMVKDSPRASQLLKRIEKQDSV